MSKYHWLLDNGHGGIDSKGKYTTCPNYDPKNPKTWHKMHVHPWGPLFEGVFNRQIVDLIAEKLCDLGIDYTVLVPESKDTPLPTRVNRANDYYKRDKRCIYVSIHGNAFNGLAKGFEIFTSKGLTRSDAIAEVFAEHFEIKFTDYVMRWDLTDKDKDKEANFYVLKNTDMPAILTENFFFDNPHEGKYMMSEDGQQKIANAHVESILQIEKGEY